MMGFPLRQEAAEQRWLHAQLPWSGAAANSPGPRVMGPQTTAPGSWIQENNLCAKQGEAKLGNSPAKLGVTAGNKELPRARTRAG